VPGKRSRQSLRLAQEALAIEAEEARKAGTLGYMARFLVQATLPHNDPRTRTFTRTNGLFRLSIIGPEGLPFGRYPRLLLAWVCTTVVTTRARVLDLGPNLTAFFGKLGVTPTGGRYGTIGPVRNQAQRLFSASISMTYENPDVYDHRGFRLADRLRLHKRPGEVEDPSPIVEPEETLLWWNADPGQPALFGSYVALTEGFRQAILLAPIPLDLRVLHRLRSPLAIDIYVWLTYRFSYLSRQTQVPWSALALQFGADYARTKAFAHHFRRQLRKVLLLYPSARVEPTRAGLILRPASPHIRKLLPKG